MARREDTRTSLRYLATAKLSSRFTSGVCGAAYEWWLTCANRGPLILRHEIQKRANAVAAVASLFLVKSIFSANSIGNQGESDGVRVTIRREGWRAQPLYETRTWNPRWRASSSDFSLSFSLSLSLSLASSLSLFPLVFFSPRAILESMRMRRVTDYLMSPD